MGVSGTRKLDRVLRFVLLISLAHVATSQVSCPAGNTDCDGAGVDNSCCLCAPGKYKNVIGTQACTDCPAGTYGNLAGATSVGSCSSCPSTTYSPVTGAVNSDFCSYSPLGTFSLAASSTFTRCPIGTYSNSHTNVCSECTPGKYQDHTGKRYCEACPPNTYSANTKQTNSSDCLACPVNTVTITTISTSINSCICTEGYTGPNGGPCVACEPGKYKFTQGTSACLTCAASTFSGVGFKTCCSNSLFQNCLPEQYLDGTCKTCPPNSSPLSVCSTTNNCVCNMGFTGPANACVACPAGKYKNVEGSSPCTSCSAASFNPLQGSTLSSACIEACIAGEYSSTVGATTETCFGCPLGKSTGYGPQSTCYDCSAGKFTPYSNMSSCVNCAPGKYSALQGATSISTCLDCPAGKFSNTFGATTSSVCINCAPMKTSPPGSTNGVSCVCNAGYYLSELPYMIGIQQGYPIANLTSMGCTKNYDSPYSHTTRSSNIVKSGWTVIGSKTDTFATSFSLVASIKATLFVTSSSTTVAYPSNNAFWYFTSSSVGFAPSSNINLNLSDIESTNCEQRLSWNLGGVIGGWRSGCTTSLNTNSVWIKSVYTCQTTQMQSCAACPEGTSSPAGSTALGACAVPPCPAGSTGPNQTSCALCEAGKYKTTIGSGVCTNCGAGTYSTEAGASACTHCGLGTYSAAVGATAASTCTGCPTNTVTSTTGMTAISDCLCNLGYTGPNGGTCTTCVAGKYKAVTGAASCTDCSLNTYSAALGATAASTCTGCPTNAVTSATGQTAISACLCNLGYSGPNGGTCTICALNTYKGTTGSAACTACPANAVTSATGQTASSACLCNLGFTGPNGGPCVANCRELWGDFQYYCTVTCGSGQYLTYTQAFEGPDGNLDYLYRYGYCASCAAGTCPSAYSNTITGRKAFGCGLCPCDAGFTGPDGGPCTACAAGKYKRDTGSAACTDCGLGTYSAAVGATLASTCTACPANAVTSATGQTAISACSCNLGYSGPNGGTCTACVAGTYGIASGYFPGGIQRDYPMSAISNLGCVACYDETYSHATTISNIEACKTAAGSTGWILMGSRTNDTATSFSLIASIKGTNFVTSESITVAYLSNGAYWYYNSIRSVGFAQSSVVSLTSADVADYTTNCANRLSWMINTGLGYRSGCTLDARAPWRKIMYSCNNMESCAACPAGKFSTATGAATSNTCLSCPNNTQAMPGSDAVTDCVCNAGYRGTRIIIISNTFCQSYIQDTYIYFQHWEDRPAYRSIDMTKFIFFYPSKSHWIIGPTPGVDSAWAYISSNAEDPSNIVLWNEWCGSAWSNKTALMLQWYDNHTTCIICEAGKYSAANASICTNCGAGKYLLTTGATVASSCVDCGAGKYSVTLGAQLASTCLDCGVNTYSTTTGATAASTCVACTSNSQSVSGSTAATSCVCNPGFTGPNGGVCTACPAGAYKPDVGAGTCSACPVNSLSPEGSTAISACLCNAGYETALDGSGVIVACSACPTGKYKAAAGSASGCRLCESDLSFSTGAFDSASPYCVCRPGYVLDAGACRACQKGMYKENQGNLTLGCASLLDGCCPCGQFQTTASAGSSVALTDCVCLHGHGVADPNNFACMPCPRGTYKEGTDRQACAACPAGTSTGEVGAFEARECVSRAGYFMVFDAGGLGTAHACASGTYSDHLNATACEPCFAGATSPPASESIAACACEPPFAPSGAALDCTCAAGFALA